MKHRTKLMSLLLTVILMLGAVSGFAEASTTGVKISLLNSKGGAYMEPLEKMAEAYRQLTGVEIEIVNTPDSDSPFEKISTMYNSGNPPTIAMLDPTDVVAIGPEKGLDLSGEAWNEVTGTLAAVVDGAVYGFPFCVEGKGILYNKTAVEKALGRAFDPSALKNANDLKALFDELQKGGMEGPMVLMKETWSLGAHFLQLVYESQGDGSKEANEAFIEQLKAGDVKLMENERFNQYMDTFDILKAYNYKKIVTGDFMSGDNMTDMMTLAEGDAGLSFNGNWAWPSMKDYAPEGNEYGMMPVVTNAPDGDFANTGMEAWASKHLMIDREKSTPEQQQAAKDFLNWLVYDEAGQKFLVEDMNLVPACSNNPLEPTDPLSQSVKQFVDEGKVFASAVVPGDHWSVLGVSMQKYLGDQIDRAALASEIEAYWAAQANQ